MAKKSAKKAAAKKAPVAAKKAVAKKPVKKAAGKSDSGAVSSERLVEMLHFVSKQLESLQSSPGTSRSAFPAESSSRGIGGGALSRGGDANAAVSKDTIRPEVVAAIDREAGRNNADAGQRADLRAGANLTLQSDLNINGARRRALCKDYTIISQGHGGIEVGQLESEDATTVSKAVDLVHKMANGG